MIIYTKILWFAAGLTVSQRLIIMHPNRVNDAALLAHERVHQAQMARMGTLTFWWGYLTSKAHRQAYEVEAYKVQIANGASIFSCAIQLSNGYGLNLTQAESLKLLES